MPGALRSLTGLRRRADADRAGAVGGAKADDRAEQHDKRGLHGCGHHVGEGTGPRVQVAADDGGGPRTNTTCPQSGQLGFHDKGRLSAEHYFFEASGPIN